MTVSQWQKIVDNWIVEYGVRYFDIKTNNLLLVEEMGEFTRLIARHYGEQSFKSSDDKDDIQAKIQEELGDMIFVITCMANQMDIDLQRVLEQNIAKKTLRDKDRHKNNSKLQD